MLRYLLSYLLLLWELLENTKLKFERTMTCVDWSLNRLKMLLGTTFNLGLKASLDV